jgi:hypothetical protein
MSGGGIGSFDRFCSGTVSVTPGAIAANTSAEVAVTITGILPGDLVINFVKPTLTAGIDIGNFRVFGANSIRVTYQNSTGSPVTPPTEIYSYYIVRPEKTLGGPDALVGTAVFN